MKELILQTLEIRDRKLAKILGRKTLVGQVIEFHGKGSTTAKAAALLRENQEFLEKNIRVKNTKITQKEAEELWARDS